MKKMKKMFFNLSATLAPVAGSFFISAGWAWHHYLHSERLRIILFTIIGTLVLTGFFYLGRLLFKHLTVRFNRHEYWSTIFASQIHWLWLALSLPFLIFFIKNEAVDLLLFSIALITVFGVLDQLFISHPNTALRRVNRAVAIFVLFIFAFNAVTQYLAYTFYVLDPGAKYFHIVLFRAWAMTMFWLAGFSVAYLIYLSTKRRVRRLLIVAWSVLFGVAALFWGFNISTLLFSGLYLTPTAVLHADSNPAMLLALINGVNLTSFFATMLALWLFWRFKRKFFFVHTSIPARYAKLYHGAIIFIAIFSFVSIASFQTTAEYTVLKSFYQYFAGESKPIELSPAVKEKLARYGINYKYDQFALAEKAAVFPTSSPRELLPSHLKTSKPNIIVVFLESFSARLTDIYNPQNVNVTPRLKELADNKNTTVFKNVYNASTPTITGIIAELCSFLPPTGHNEFENENRLRKLYLLCLPQILKDNGWGYSAYITAVDKNYANKNSVFKSMGMDEVIGTEELRDMLKTEPLAWGYSDHQMFPVLTELAMKEYDRPFFLSLSTVDTHPPFTVAKDMINYEGGDNVVLNSVHTTDDAFGQFYQAFMSSPRSQDTILIAVADHAIFPTAYTKKYFPAYADKATYYDELTYLMYIPDSVLPRTVNTYGTSLDFTPTLLEILDINLKNSFDGHSLLSDRAQYPYLLGMHEFGLYTNEPGPNNSRSIQYAPPAQITCSDSDYTTDPATPLTLCEYLDFYKFKRQAFEQGRFWEK